MLFLYKYKILLFSFVFINKDFFVFFVFINNK